MLINQVSQLTQLTKKAIEYYTAQALIAPVLLDNGYRDFSENDVARLKKIAVLRQLDLSIDAIKTVLADDTGNTLQKLSVQKQLNVQQAQAKKALLDQLSSGTSYAKISTALDTMAQSATITEKLLLAFNNISGYYDIFIPAMKRLSTSYADYAQHLAIANEKLLAHYPDIANLNN